MSEFFNFISPEQFEDGLSRRLLIGEVVVGQICKIRIENPKGTFSRSKTTYGETTISILKKIEQSAGWITLEYVYEVSRLHSEPIIDGDDFTPDSIATHRRDGTPARAYLTDDPDSRWDESLEALVDLESNVHA